jgi:hypothetical protein
MALELEVRSLMFRSLLLPFLTVLLGRSQSRLLSLIENGQGPTIIEHHL